MPTRNAPEIPEELKGAADKLSQHDDRINKAYSTERYEEFMCAVKKIVLEVLDSSSAETIIKKQALNAVTERSITEVWKRVNFWTTAIISILGLIVAIISLVRSFK